MDSQIQIQKFGKNQNFSEEQQKALRDFCVQTVKLSDVRTEGSLEVEVVLFSIQHVTTYMCV